jgi:hypothetical protein
MREREEGTWSRWFPFAFLSYRRDARIMSGMLSRREPQVETRIEKIEKPRSIAPPDSPPSPNSLPSS